MGNTIGGYYTQKYGKEYKMSCWLLSSIHALAVIKDKDFKDHLIETLQDRFINNRCHEISNNDMTSPDVVKQTEMFGKYITVISQLIYLILDPDNKVKSRKVYTFPFEPYEWSMVLEKVLRTYTSLTTDPVTRAGCEITTTRLIFGTTSNDNPFRIWDPDEGILIEGIPFTNGSYSILNCINDKEYGNPNMIHRVFQFVDRYRTGVQYITISVPGHVIALYLSNDSTYWIGIDSSWRGEAPTLEGRDIPKYGLPRRRIDEIAKFEYYLNGITVVMPTNIIQENLMLLGL